MGRLENGCVGRRPALNHSASMCNGYPADECGTSAAPALCTIKLRMSLVLEARTAMLAASVLAENSGVISATTINTSPMTTITSAREKPPNRPRCRQVEDHVEVGALMESVSLAAAQVSAWPGRCLRRWSC